MLRGTRLVALSATLAAALLLTGCAPDPTPAATVPPIPSTTSWRHLSSDEFVIAGQSAYKKYLKAVDRATATRAHKDVEALKSLVSAKMYRESQESVAQAERQGIRAVGRTRLVSFKKQQVRTAARTITAYVCLNFKNVRLLDKAEKDVTPVNRADLQQYLVTLAVRGGALVIVAEGAWDGENVC